MKHDAWSVGDHISLGHGALSNCCGSQGAVLFHNKLFTTLARTNIRVGNTLLHPHPVYIAQKPSMRLSTLRQLVALERRCMQFIFMA